MEQEKDNLERNERYVGKGTCFVLDGDADEGGAGDRCESDCELVPIDSNIQQFRYLCRIASAQVVEFSFKLENALESNVLLKQDLDDQLLENQRLRSQLHELRSEMSFGPKGGIPRMPNSSGLSHPFNPRQHD